jgi:hypothetical protein
VDADVGFGFDDAGAELSATTPVDENLAEQIGREFDRGAFIEITTQLFLLQNPHGGLANG